MHDAPAGALLRIEAHGRARRTQANPVLEHFSVGESWLDRGAAREDPGCDLRVGLAALVVDPAHPTEFDDVLSAISVNLLIIG